LIRVGIRWAVVARVANAVVVVIGLVGVGCENAVVELVEDAVAVAVLAGVADAVEVAVGLICVRDARAVVAGVADAVVVLIELVVVADERAVVADIAEGVAGDEGGALEGVGVQLVGLYFQANGNFYGMGERASDEGADAERRELRNSLTTKITKRSEDHEERTPSDQPRS